MIELTASAQSRLNDYLSELRRVLQECPAVDPLDVERDVHDHIEAALSGAAIPVDEPHLDRVLRSLGVPRDWVQDIGRPWYRYPQHLWRGIRQELGELTLRLVAGPESYRLPYLSFSVLVSGAFLSAFASHEEETLLILLIAGCASFVLARAALAVHEARPSKAQIWLLAPALLAMYVPLAGAIAGWPILTGTIAIFEVESEFSRETRYLRSTEQLRENLAAIDTEIPLATALQQEERVRQLTEARSGVTRQLDVVQRSAEAYPLPLNPPYLRQVHPVWLAVFAAAAATGLWWLILGLVAWRRPCWFRAVFRPFADGFQGRGGLLLCGVGFVLLAAGLALCFG